MARCGSQSLPVKPGHPQHSDYEYERLGTANLFVSLTIAITKASLVLLVFMELKASTGLVRVFACAGFFWLLIMIGLTSADYTHRTDQRTSIDKLG